LGDLSTWLDLLNKKRKDLFKVVLIMLDELMSGWRPKTTKAWWSTKHNKRAKKTGVTWYPVQECRGMFKWLLLTP